VEHGLIGPREAERIWSRHLLNCAAVAELIPPAARVVDVGSGAGLPGIALAVARPELHVLLVEPLLRRAEWLSATVGELGLAGVEVRRARAEEVVGTVEADVVTARAVAALPRLARWCLPLVRPGGALLAVKGASAGAELAAAAPVLRELGARRWEVLSCGSSFLETPTTVAAVVAGRGRGGRRRPERRNSPRL
jgi:16S rRNA (guanine527-N7)-methyltransferase